MRVCAVIAGLALLSADRLVAQGMEFCVVRTDTTVPFFYTGYSFRSSVRTVMNRVVDHAYPVVISVDSGSPADRVGLRVGDEIRMQYGFDVVGQYDSIAAHRPKGPGIPIPMQVQRGATSLDLTITPTELPKREGKPKCTMPPLSGRSGRPPR